MSKTAETNKISLKFSRKSRAHDSDYTVAGVNPFYPFNGGKYYFLLVWNSLRYWRVLSVINHFPSMITKKFVALTL